jgi:hypothetical protein
MSTQSKLVSATLSYNDISAGGGDCRLRETTPNEEVQKSQSEWFGQDLDAFAETVSKAFHRAKKQAIEENIRVFGRAEGPVIVKK